MPWAAGIFSRTDGTRTGATVWAQAKAALVKIIAADHDTHDQDLATGINSTLTKDGSNSPSANLPMATFKHTNVGASAARTDYARTDQVQDGAFINAGVAGGTAAALTGTLSPAITAYAQGQVFIIEAASASVAGATADFNGVGAVTVLKHNDQAIEAGDWEAGQMLLLAYEATAPAFQLLSVSAREPAMLDEANTFTAQQIVSGAGFRVNNGNLVVGDGKLNVFETTAATAADYIHLRNEGDGDDYLFRMNTTGDLQIWSEANGSGTKYLELGSLAGLALSTLTPQAVGTANAVDYYRNNVKLLPVVQQVAVSSTGYASGSTPLPYDDTIPTQTTPVEGTQFMTLAITPTNASNILVIDVLAAQVSFNTSSSHQMTMALFQDTTNDALAATSRWHNVANAPRPHVLRHRMVAGTASATTFKVRIGADIAGTVEFNGVSGARTLGGISASSIIITEYSA